MKKVIIFGVSKLAALFKQYLEQDGNCQVCAFTVSKDYLKERTFCGLDVVDFSTIAKAYPPNEHQILLTVGYRDMNDERKKIYQEVKTKGYTIFSYISSKAIVLTDDIGEGNIILEGCVIQPTVKIGKCNIFWSSVNVSHHTEIGDFNFFAPSSSLAGNIAVSNNCMFGNNSCLRDGIIINEYTLVGAGCYVSKNTNSYDVILPAKSVTLVNKKSTDFTI